MPFFSNSSAIFWYLPWLSANVLIASSRLKAPLILQKDANSPTGAVVRVLV